MAQKIVTVCDAHADTEEHAGAAQGPISLDGGRTFYATDLCDVAAKEFIQPLRELLAEHGRTLTAEEVERARPRVGKKPGRKPNPDAVKAGSWPCALCDEGPFARSSLRTHVPARHGQTLAQLEAELGHTLDGRVVTHHCDDCGGGFAEERGLSVHLRRGCPDKPLPVKKRTKKAAK